MAVCYQRPFKERFGFPHCRHLRSKTQAFVARTEQDAARLGAEAPTDPSAQLFDAIDPQRHQFANLESVFDN